MPKASVSQGSSTLNPSGPELELKKPFRYGLTSLGTSNKSSCYRRINFGKTMTWMKISRDKIFSKGLRPAVHLREHPSDEIKQWNSKYISPMFYKLLRVNLNWQTLQLLFLFTGENSTDRMVLQWNEKYLYQFWDQEILRKKTSLVLTVRVCVCVCWSQKVQKLLEGASNNYITSDYPCKKRIWFTPVYCISPLFLSLWVSPSSLNSMTHSLSHHLNLSLLSSSRWGVNPLGV